MGEHQKPAKEVQPPAQRQQREEVKAVQTRAQVDSDSSQALTTEASDSQEYLDLHNTISGRSFNSKVVQILNDIVEVVTEKSFLNISEVVKGGSVGKGTAISGTTDAEVVFFLKGMPKGLQTKWLPPLLKAVSGVLNEHFGSGHGMEGISTTTDSVYMKVKG